VPFDHAAPPETQDPRATLKARSIHQRCSAARDLSRYGTPDDIPLLVAQAQADISPAVRLGTAGAAADILSRYRVGPRAGELSAARRTELFELFKGMDPGVNAGLFSMLACIGIPQGFQRIAVGLRDPRGDVRIGAAIGLLRLCASAASQGDTELEAAVVQILRDPRLRPDAAAEVSWVAARVGYRSAREAIGALSLSGTQAELQQRALTLLREFESPLRGAFVTDGRDAGEVGPEPAQPVGFAAFSESGALMGDGEDPAGWSYLDGVLPGGIRRMFVRQVGAAEPSPAFQLSGRTWYAATEAAVNQAALDLARPDELHWEGLSAASPLEEHGAAVFQALLPADAPGDLARGLLRARAGDLDGAVAALQACVDWKKRVPPEAPYFLGRALLAAGQDTAGKAALGAFIKKAKKKDPRRETAEALVG